MKSFSLEITGSKEISNIANKLSDKKLSAFIFSAIFHILCLFLIFYFTLNKNSNNEFEIKTLQIVSLEGIKKTDNQNHKKIVKKELTKNNNPALNKLSSNIVEKKSESSEETISSNQSEVINNLNTEYVNLIAYKLNKYKSRFSMANSPQSSGTVVFRVVLTESGKIKSYKLLQSSNHEFFDKIAEKIISSANSFPAPPKEIISLGLEFNVPIIFDVKA